MFDVEMKKELANHPTTTVEEKLELLTENVLYVLADHEAAGYRKTGTGDYPLASLYQDLTHSQRASHYTPQRWQFRAPNTFGAKPVGGLVLLLEAAGFEVYDDDTNKRAITRVRIA